MSYGQSLLAQLLFEGKLADYSVDVSQSLNMPIWYNGEDWAEDNVFMIYQMDVSNLQCILKSLKVFLRKLQKN